MQYSEFLPEMLQTSAIPQYFGVKEFLYVEPSSAIESSRLSHEVLSAVQIAVQNVE